MKSNTSRSSWSFFFLGKRQQKARSTSTFYFDNYYDTRVLSSTSDLDTSISRNGIEVGTGVGQKPLNNTTSFEVHRSACNMYDQDDTDDLLPFCCGLRKLSQRSTSFDSKADQNECTKVSDKNSKQTTTTASMEVHAEEPSALNVVVPMRCKQTHGDVVGLLPCKKASLYPYGMGSEASQGSEGDFLQENQNAMIVNPHAGEMLSIQERKKLIELAMEAGRHQVAAKADDIKSRTRKQFSPRSIRNSFTTEDMDLFMKTPNLSGQHRFVQNPSVAPKPKSLVRSKLLSPSSHCNSDEMHAQSMRNLTCIDSTPNREESKVFEDPQQCTSKSCTPGELQEKRYDDVFTNSTKPKIPPKSTKLLSYIAQHQPKDVLSEPRNDEKHLESSSTPEEFSSDLPGLRFCKSSLTDSSSSIESIEEDSDEDAPECRQEDVYQTAESEDPSTKFSSRSHQIANELLQTEKLYVHKLHLIDQIFQMEIIRKNREERFLPDEVIPLIFSNIKSIYQFHNDYLLPELTSSLDKWDEGSRVGIVMKKAAPFFKLYTDFVTNFSNANNLIASWISKSEKFAALLNELQKLPECGNLTLQHHLLEPIQRVPRYQLLLGDYLKYLPEDAPDKEPVKDALKLVSEAAQHTNDEMKKLEKFNKLLEICALFEHYKDENLISINRELIKNGKIVKISARDGSLHERHLFLFNDILLVCVDLPLKIGFSQQYRIKSKLDICGMKVYEGNNEDHAYSFVIMSRQKSVEFASSCEEEKNEWIAALWAVIKQYVDKEQTKDKKFFQKTYEGSEELGKRAPTWVKDQDTSMCMLCSTTFKTFRRRHHCRACGKVICNICSSHKLRMDFDRDRLNRVCDVCYGALHSSFPSTPRIIQRHKGPSVLGMKATNEETVLCGYFHASYDSKAWNRRWLVLHSNGALYIFKAKRDNTAIDSLPLPGYSIEICVGEDMFKSNVFKIFHDKLPKIYFFSTGDKSLFTRCVDLLKLAIVAQLPLPSSLRPLSVSQNSPFVSPLGKMTSVDETDGIFVNEVQ